MDQINWSNEPPRVPAARVWIPLPGKNWITLLGNCKGVWVHWTGKRTVPCLGTDCPKARHNRSTFWVGYYPALFPQRDSVNPDKWNQQLIVFPCSAEVFHQNDNTPHSGMRGVNFLIDKEGGKRSWKVEKVSRHPYPEKLPPAFDVGAVLYRLWGMLPPCSVNAPFHHPATPHQAQGEVGEGDPED